MWLVTPPGYVHEYGETRATRIPSGCYGTGAAGPVGLTGRNARRILCS